MREDTLAQDTLALATDTLAHIHVTKSPGAVLTPAVHAHAPPLSTVLT